jgi:hypothetical protein
MLCACFTMRLFRSFVAADKAQGFSQLWHHEEYPGQGLMDTLTAFGLFAVTLMLVCYAAEDRSPWFVLAFAAACALGSIYGFLQGAWPFGLIEAIWSVVALRRWLGRRA